MGLSYVKIKFNLYLCDKKLCRNIKNIYVYNLSVVCILIFKILNYVKQISLVIENK